MKRNKHTTKVKPDSTLRAIWLIKRKMKNADDAQRTELINKLNDI